MHGGMKWGMCVRWGLLAALGLGALAGCSKRGASESVEGKRVPGALVVDFKDGTTKAQFDVWERDWGIDLELNSIEGERSGITLAQNVEADGASLEALLARIRQHPEVEAAEPLYVYGTRFAPNDPHYAKQWNLKLINAERAWDTSRGKGVVVAVLDTGIAYEDTDEFAQVPDLKGAKFVKGYDFVNDDDGAHDDHGHGTHVAGTIAQRTHNGEGVAGVAFEATLMPVKVLDAFGGGTSSDIADAIRWAADNGAQVINMSLGGGARSEVMERAVNYARGKGVTIVAAAGNAGRGVVEFPAAYPGVIAVSAVGPSGTLAPYSSWGAQIAIAAPGGDKSRSADDGVLQNTIDPRDPKKNVYAAYQGTSMATPHVAGVAALLISAGARTPEEVEQALFKGAKKVAGQKEKDDRYGHGLLDAEGALAALPGGFFGGINWRPLFAAMALLVVVLLTIRARERPGYLNVLLRPSFLAPLLLSTVGFFVLRWMSPGASGGTMDTLWAHAALPIPDWERIIFGRGKLANPLFYSALIPAVLSILAIRAVSLRPVIAGLSLGFAGFLVYAALAKAPGLSWLPFHFLALPWLLVNAVVCLFIARAMLVKNKDVAMGIAR